LSKDLILSIDPGNVSSALVFIVGEHTGALSLPSIHKTFYGENESCLIQIIANTGRIRRLIIEDVVCMGMPAGKTLFDTAKWVGRFVQFWHDFCSLESPTVVPRHQIKMHHCGSTRAKDANIRQAVIDRFPATGGGKVPQIGTSKQKGPLYGISGDLWSALAIALYAFDQEAAATTGAKA
jgi:hypothetical protein